MAAVRHTSPDTGSLRKYDYAHPGYQRELAAFLLGLGLGGEEGVGDELGVLLPFEHPPPETPRPVVGVGCRM
mgnify:CR=1 FL=1